MSDKHLSDLVVSLTALQVETAALRESTDARFAALNQTILDSHFDAMQKKNRCQLSATKPTSV
jgi:hypothetical protein